MPGTHKLNSFSSSLTLQQTYGEGSLLLHFGWYGDGQSYIHGYPRPVPSHEQYSPTSFEWKQKHSYKYECRLHSQQLKNCCRKARISIKMTTDKNAHYMCDLWHLYLLIKKRELVDCWGVSFVSAVGNAHLQRFSSIWFALIESVIKNAENTVTHWRYMLHNL